MYKAFGSYVDNSSELRGVNKIVNSLSVPKTYPSNNDVIGSLEHASIIHKEVRRFLQPHLKPGVKLLDIAKLIELKTTELSDKTKSVNKGIGFPVSLAVNECAAHWHPLSNDNTVLNKNDILKIDFGTEANSWIIDSAFTVYFDPKFDPLAEAVKDATLTGIKNIGIDVDIGDWGKQIQEVMESHEILLDGKTHPIKAICNLGGHNIKKGIIHGGIFLPAVDLKTTLPLNYRFKEGVYAVETFGSTGHNITTESGESTLYRVNPAKQINEYELKLDSTKKLFNRIGSSFSTLPFTDRYVELFNLPNYKSNLKLLVNYNYVLSYPPLCVNKGDYTAQYEHTVYIGESNKKIFSSGEDY